MPRGGLCILQLHEVGTRLVAKCLAHMAKSSQHANRAQASRLERVDQQFTQHDKAQPALIVQGAVDIENYEVDVSPVERHGRRARFVVHGLRQTGGLSTVT
jgi:hypothetical protein